MAKVTFKLEKEKKIEKEESVEITIPSYYQSTIGAMMVSKDTIICAYKDFLVTYPLTYDNFKSYCDRDPSDRETFLSKFQQAISSIQEKIIEPSIFDELKNDEEHYYEEDMMQHLEEEYYYSQENP
jgi:hypothetical protein